MENDKGSRDEAEGEDDADGVGQTDPDLTAVVKKKLAKSPFISVVLI